jgi:nucleotide-binding universal stress UspA family protein
MPVPVHTPAEDAVLAETTAALRAGTERLLSGYGMDWTFHARDGDPATVLSDIAADTDAYCIVVGTRGEGVGATLTRLIRPSVSHALIRRRQRPVLVVSVDEEQQHAAPPARDEQPR